MPNKYKKDLIELLIESLRLNLFGTEEPRNWAKGLLVWIDTHPANNWGWDLSSILDILLDGIEEWDNLEPEERDELAEEIYEELEKLAKKEEEWAGLSPEEWLELLKQELIKRKEIKNPKNWVKDLWNNWLKYYINRLSPKDILDTVFEGNPDWDWMPKKEKRELAEEVIDLIMEKVEEEGLI
jgi:hypothetical protein